MQLSCRNVCNKIIFLFSRRENNEKPYSCIFRHMFSYIKKLKGKSEPPKHIMIGKGIQERGQEWRLGFPQDTSFKTCGGASPGRQSGQESCGQRAGMSALWAGRRRAAAALLRWGARA